MNSIIQCLRASDQLLQLFLSPQGPPDRPARYVSQLNKESANGRKGAIACAFAELMGEMSSNAYRSVAPAKLKTVVQGFAPQFAGYSQHDSQEVIQYNII